MSLFFVLGFTSLKVYRRPDFRQTLLHTDMDFSRTEKIYCWRIASSLPFFLFMVACIANYFFLLVYLICVEE